MNNEKKIIQESFSDYELYQILEENGYTTTEKNLSILKEGLDSGKYTLIEKDCKDFRELKKRIKRISDPSERLQRIRLHNDWVKQDPRAAAHHGYSTLPET